jgi:hypothetical protein
MENIYYHGSPNDIRNGYLTPRPTSVLDGEDAVFATSKYSFALVFGAKWSDSDIEFGIINGVPIIKEQYPNAFDLLKTEGWIYLVDKIYFENDKRLGLQGFEFISKKRVPIIKAVYVKNLFTEIENLNEIKFIYKK